jgi:predicted RNase H-like nuclease (RuvC/YqgF family)
MTTQEEKIRVNARIPKPLYDFVCSEYDNVSQAINEGLEKLRESKSSEMSYTHNPDIQDSHTSPENVIQEHTNVIQRDIHVLTARTEEQKAKIENYQDQVKTLNAEIARLQSVIMEAPDPLEIVKLQERNQGLNMLIEEKNRSIERLEKEVNRLDTFSHYFKSNPVKQIEAPGEKKKPWYKFW